MRKLTPNQRTTLERLDNYRPLHSGPPGWLSTRLFDPITVRSLIRYRLVQPSTTLEWMLKYNLNDMTIRITEKGQQRLSARLSARGKRGG